MLRAAFDGNKISKEYKSIGRHTDFINSTQTSACFMIDDIIRLMELIK